MHEGRAKRSDERNSGGLVYVCVLVHSACIISYMYVRVYVISPPMARLPCHISHLSLHTTAAYVIWCLWCGYHLMSVGVSFDINLVPWPKTFMR